jgi:tricarballylate dehydrogenase
MDWAQEHGMRFRRQPTYFINSVRKRQQPVGGGEAMRRALDESAQRLGVETRYGVTATGFARGADGLVEGVDVVVDGAPQTVPARTVVIAAGGFEGNPEWLEHELGAGGSELPTIAPGGGFNRGEVLAAALDLGAARAGQWNSFHAEPVDPRSTDAEALVMIYPYGIVVDAHGERFMDEGRGTVDETYEGFARSVWERDGRIAYFITDQQILSVTERERGVLTSVPAVTADTVEGLAEALGLPAQALRATVDGFNAATRPGAFDWRAPDGLATTGVEPPKSNWAVPLESPPFQAYPVRCSICFTFGGLATDLEARVVREDGAAIGGLYAAGECTGLYFGKYPGGTSVMRGMVFGRVAGAAAADEATARREVSAG